MHPSIFPIIVALLFSMSEALDHELEDLLAEVQQDFPVEGPRQDTVGTWSLIQDDASPNFHASNHDIHLSDSWLRLVHDTNADLPVCSTQQLWERPSFLNTVMSRPSYRVCMPTVITAQPMASHHTPARVVHPPEHAWRAVAHRLNSVRSSHSNEAKREYAIQKWKSILQIAPKHSETGRTLLQNIWALHDNDQLNTTLQDVFSSKSTATILKRANAFSRYVVWCSKKSLCPLPVKESHVYTYLYDNNWRGPTSSMSFRESLNFASGVLGIDGSLESASSSRVTGFCRRLFVQKRPLKQARTLTVAQLSALEEFVTSADELDHDPIDVIFVGHVLFTLYSRSRWTDSLYVSKLELDLDSENNGYIQADTLVSKTSVTIQKKTRFLPLTGPIHGITTNSWVQIWLSYRLQYGLQQPDGVVPIIQTVTTAGNFSGKALLPSEAGDWLRSVLISLGFSKEQVQGVSSHSLKATLLSWMAKFGTDISKRQLLGYHVTGNQSSSLHYSRDELAEPLRELDKMLAAVRAGSFRPDVTRSGYFVSPQPKSSAGSTTMPVDRQAKGNIEPIASSDEEDAGSSSSLSSAHSADLSDDEHLFNVVPDEVKHALRTKRRRSAASSHDVNMFIHSRWKTLHASKSGDESRLACGRAITSVYTAIPFGVDFPYTKCAICFGQEQL